MVTSKCKYCGAKIVRAGSKPGVFCSLKCKGNWQRERVVPPFSKEWAYQKYVEEGLGTYRMGALVGCDPKTVYLWLKTFEIPIRKRDWGIVSDGKKHQDRDWLIEHYVNQEMSCPEIAMIAGVTENNIYYFMEKFEIERRDISEARAVKYWGLEGQSNGMYGRTGPQSSCWKGGCTPDRQAFYKSLEWNEASKEVWSRDMGMCQRCGAESNDGIKMHIHHIVSFSAPELRAELSNLVLLCVKCHRFVHSKGNTHNEFI